MDAARPLGTIEDLDPGFMSLFGSLEPEAEERTQAQYGDALGILSTYSKGMHDEAGLDEDGLDVAGLDEDGLDKVSAAAEESEPEDASDVTPTWGADLAVGQRRERGAGLASRMRIAANATPAGGARAATATRTAPPSAAPPPCRDKGPWPCAEKGCPSASVSCQDMSNTCKGTFADVFLVPPPGLRSTLVSAECPRLCSKCPLNIPHLLSRGGANVPSISETSRAVRAIGGEIFDKEIPAGENLEYRAPRTLAGYKDMVDGTSYAAEARKGREGRGCRRIFQVGSRGDMRTTVRPMLQELGTCEVKGGSEHSSTAASLHSVDVLWTKPWENVGAYFRPAKLRAGLIVNSIPGLSAQIGMKTSLARLHVRCFERFGFDPLDPIPEGKPWCRFTQRGFAVRRSGASLQIPAKRFRRYNLELDRARRESHRIWILKPQFGFNQVGIHMYSLGHDAMESDDAMGAWLLKHVPDGTWVLQEYVMNPMTYNGNKFDLRIWAMVTSLDPLRIYLLGSGIPKVSQWRYSKEPSYVKQQCIHVLLPGTTECFTGRDAQVNIIRPYPHHTNDAGWYAAMGPSAGKAFWEKEAWRSLEWQLSELLLLARDSILHADHQLKRKQDAYKRVFFLQPDVVFDASGRASLVEVNTNGYMIGNLHKDFFALHREQRAVLAMMGGNGFPRRYAYEKALDAKTAAFCKERGCREAMEREIQEMVHEDMHCAHGWYRIFPTGDDAPYVRAFKKEPLYAASFTPLDRLMFEWIEQGWAPKHTHDRNGSVVVSRH